MNKSEIVFLSGPHSRWTELKFTVKIALEMIKGLSSGLAGTHRPDEGKLDDPRGGYKSLVISAPKSTS